MEGQDRKIFLFSMLTKGKSATEELIKSLPLCRGQGLGNAVALPSIKQPC